MMYRVALVGAGGMAREYRKVYTQLPMVRWVLAVDVNPAELEACAKLGVGRTSSRFEDALADDIDVVDISTPNHLHESQAIAALRAGKHVLLQKPMANSLEAADRILETARQSKGKLGIYMSKYASPLIWQVKRLIDGGHLGDIQSVRTRYAWRGARSASGTWRSDRQQTGGGCFIQLATHHVNLVQWWLDGRVDEIFAYSDNQYSPTFGGDDVTMAVARLRRRQHPVPVYTCFESCYASEDSYCAIYGTRGWVKVTDSDRGLSLKLDEPWRDQGIDYTPGEPRHYPAPPCSLSDAASPLNPQRVFFERLAAGQEPFMSGQQGRCDLAVVMAAYESAALNKPVTIPQA